MFGIRRTIELLIAELKAYRLDRLRVNDIESRARFRISQSKKVQEYELGIIANQLTIIADKLGKIEARTRDKDAPPDAVAPQRSPAPVEPLLEPYEFGDYTDDELTQGKWIHGELEG